MEAFVKFHNRTYGLAGLFPHNHEFPSAQSLPCSRIMLQTEPRTCEAMHVHQTVKAHGFCLPGRFPDREVDSQFPLKAGTNY